MRAGRAAGLLSVILVACASAGPPPSVTPPKSAWHKAPPKPGSSITHTKLCECQSCEIARCCAGETSTSAENTCDDSYDFTREGCGLDVASCTGRCSKHVWRVPLSEGCDDAPLECC